MTTTTTSETTPPAETMALDRPAKNVTPVAYDPNDVVGLYMNTGVFLQLQRVANLMASANLAPAHLRGQDKVADCFLVVAQAFRWGMDPFAVAQGTFVLSGKLGYEGKLIAAVINTHPSIARKLDYEYEGEGDNRKVVVSARVKGEEKDRIVTGTVKGWATDNKKWREMPDQMLAYRGAREWARRHMPEAVLGIKADEEIEAEPEPAPTAKPRTLEALTERIETTNPTPAPAEAPPTPAPPAPVEAPPPAPAPTETKPQDREQGEDDGDPTPSEVVKTFAKGAVAQPAKGQRRIGE
jgi:hypothetical protein